MTLLDQYNLRPKSSYNNKKIFSILNIVSTYLYVEIVKN